jgi:nitroreductase
MVTKNRTKKERTMSEKLLRRLFLKRSSLLGGVLLFPAWGQRKAFAHTAEKEAVSENGLPMNETLKTLASLRTTHGNFKDQPIPDDQIELILKSSLRAANASNLQSYSIIIVKDRQKIKNISTYTGSCLFLYCVDYTRVKASAEFLGHPYLPDGIEAFITGSTGTILAVQSAVVAARSLGIDTLTTNGIHRGNMQRVWDILELPDTHCYPLIALVLGYATEEPSYQMGRLDGPGVVHYEKYQKLTEEQTAAITAQYDDKDQHLGLYNDWDKNGYKHYQDWLHKEWMRGGGKPLEKESQMFKLLKRSRFVDLQKA